MGFFSRVRNIFARQKTVPEDPRRLFFWPGRTPAGIPITHENALTYSAVWGCVRVISESIAQMGAHVYQPITLDRSERISHTVDYLVDKQANPELSAFTFRETMLAHALTWGNGYAEIERDNAGRATWLWPITPDRVNPERTRDGALIYDISNRGNSNAVLPPTDIFHLHGLGFDGVQGYSVIGLARKAIGLGLATEEFGSTFFGNGTHLGGVLEHPAKLTKEAQERLAASWAEKYGSARNAFKPAILEEGMKWHQVGVPPEDAQFLETRKFQVHEVCRWYRVPPHKLADLERATFSNIEHQSIEFVTDTLVPWVTRFEQEGNIKLFGANRQGLFVRVNVGALLRGDLKSRYDAYAVGRQWGWLSVNDVRKLESLNPLPPEIGDVYLTPLNMGLLSADGRPQRPRTFEQPQRDEPAMPPAQRAILEAALIELGRSRNGYHDASPPNVHVQVSPPSPAVHVAPTEVRNEIHVPERHVTVENSVHVPEREVHVDARTTVPEREVKIENHVTVPERPVTVENTVHTPEQTVYVDNVVKLPENKLPPKVTETIIRDHQGEIQQIVRETESEGHDG